MNTALRLLGAGAAALAVVVVLALVVPSRPGTPAPPRRPAAPPERSARLLAGLHGRALLVYVAARAALVPGEGPVVAVGRYGALRLVRPPAVPEGPVRGPWLAAGVVAPCEDLDDLTAPARAALLDCLAALAGRGRALDPDFLVLRGVRARPRTLERLLRWCR